MLLWISAYCKDSPARITSARDVSGVLNTGLWAIGFDLALLAVFTLIRTPGHDNAVQMDIVTVHPFGTNDHITK